MEITPVLETVLSVSRASHPLCDYVAKYLIGAQKENENIWRIQMRQRAVVMLSLANVVSNVAFIPVSTDAFKDKPVLGGFLAYGNAVTWFVIGQVSWMQLVSESLERLTPEDRKMRRKPGCLGRAWDVSKMALSLSLGLLAKAGLALYDNRYTKEALLPIVVLVADGGFAASSWYNLFGKIEQKAKLNNLERSLQASKDQLLGSLRECADDWLQMKPKRLEYLRGFSALAGETNVDKSMSFIRRLLRRPGEQNIRNQRMLWQRRWGIRLLGAGFSFFSLTITWTLSGLVMENVTKNRDGQIAGQVFITGTQAYNVTKGIISVCQSWGQRLVNLVRRRNRKTLGEVLRPRLYWMLNVMGGITAGISWGVNVDIAERAIKNKDWSLAVQVMSGIGISLLGVHYMTWAVENICQKLGAKEGNEELELLARVHRKLGRLSRRIKKSSVLTWARFVQILPDDLFEKTVRNLDLNREKLGIYLGKYEERQPLLDV